MNNTCTGSRLSASNTKARDHLLTFMRVLQRCPMFVASFILNGDRYAVPLEHSSYPLSVPSRFMKALLDPDTLDEVYYSDHHHWDSVDNDVYKCAEIARLNEWPSWIRISTYDRLAVNRWFTSDETAKERQEFLDAGIALKLDRSWTWQHVTCRRLTLPVTATNEDSKIYSNTNYHHMYQIFSSVLFDRHSESFERRADYVRRENEYLLQGSINGSENHFFDQHLFILIEKVIKLLGIPRIFSEGDYQYTSDGVVFRSAARESCELVHDIWKNYAGPSDATPFKYYLNTSTRPSCHTIAIGNTAIAKIDELALDPKKKISSLPKHQLRTVEYNQRELREAIFSTDIF